MQDGVDIDALAAWMDRQGLGSGPIRDVRRLGGGTQNILLRFEREGRAYVFRRPPAHPRPNSDETMRREGRLLAALEGQAVPHPRLIAVGEAGEPGLEVAFYLMEPVEGFNPVEGLPKLHAASSDLQHRMGLALVDAIAALGDLDPDAMGLKGFGKPRGFLARQVPRWRAELESYAALDGWPGPKALPAVERIGAWLEADLPAPAAPGVVHGDYHMANAMFRYDSAELAAIVDWELATIGDPLLDLGWLLATWPEDGSGGGVAPVTPWIGFPTAAELVERYGAASERDLSRLRWYKVMACYKLAILLEGGFARSCAGKAARDVGERLHGRAVGLLERAQGWMA